MYTDEIDFVRFRPTFGILYMPMQFLEVYSHYSIAEVYSIATFYIYLYQLL